MEWFTKLKNDVNLSRRVHNYARSNSY